MPKHIRFESESKSELNQQLVNQNQIKKKIIKKKNSASIPNLKTVLR